MRDRDRFDAWLDTELRRLLHDATEQPAPSRARYRGGRAPRSRSFRLASGAGAALTAKAATGLVVAAFAVGVTGTALSGTPNPAAWGTSVVQVVDQCRSSVTEAGVGGCVAAVAEQHGDAVATPARLYAPGTATPTAQDGSGVGRDDSSRAAHGTRSHRPSPTPGRTPSEDRSPRPTPSPEASHRPEPTRSPESD